MRPEPLLIYAISILVVINIASTYYVTQVAKLSYFWTTVVAYCFAGFINHCLFVGIHDISHNVVFGNSRPIANRLFGMWANLPIAIPMASSFKKYHMDHHRFLGTEGLDVDLPTDWEGRFFNTPPMKVLFLFLYPAFYGIRPLIVRPMPLTKMEMLNLTIQLSFDAALVYFWSFKALYYLFMATFFCLGLHPSAAHFICEHYMFDRGYETYSYYGPWNILTWNIGYHMEHHDFPYIACTRLPAVRRIAAEFYDDLPTHKSWFGVWWEFVTSPSHSPYSRVKRDYEDVYGKKKGMNPYLGAENTMKPIGFKNVDGKGPAKLAKGRVKFTDGTVVGEGGANGNASTGVTNGNNEDNGIGSSNAGVANGVVANGVVANGVVNGTTTQ